MRIALLTEGGYPYARGESVVWCDRLVRGLSGHDFEVYALSRGRRQEEAGWIGSHGLPPHVRRVRTAPLWGEPRPAPGQAGGRGLQGPAAERFTRHFGALAQALCLPCPEGRETAASDGQPAEADRFANALYGLADLAAEHHGLSAALRSEQAVRILELAARAPGASRAVRSARVSDLLAVLERLERALRPLSLDWYGPRGSTGRQRCGAAEEDAGLAGVDLCHAVGGGLAALPGLLAKREFGTPLLITEYGVRLREHYLESLASLARLTSASGPDGPVDADAWGGPGAHWGLGAGAGVRALLGSFQRQLAAEAYRRAEVITPGNTHARSWQEHCGADRSRLRTVYPGMDARPFAAVAEDRGGREPAPTLVWVGRLEPAKDVATLLHAFARVRQVHPGARLMLVETRGGEQRYAAECRELVTRLFGEGEGEGEGAERTEQRPVVFRELGDAAGSTLAAAYAGASVVVRSSVVEGFPLSLVEAMFCGRATVSTDAGAVTEVIGGTGLVVPPSDPGALADACLALLADPGRRARLGAAARARAIELFTVEQNVTAFHGIYLELMSRRPRHALSATVEQLSPAEVKPFARTAEGQVAARLASGAERTTGAAGPSWARQGDASPDQGCPVGAGAPRRGEVR